MPRASLGPRLWFDPGRENWVIRDGRKFIRTGAAGWKLAQKRLVEYLENDPLDRCLDANAIPNPVVGLVYFVSADFPEFPIKIGFTQKLSEIRARDIQTGCPYKLVPLGAFAGTYGDENALHKRFAAQRLEGEWFSRSPELMDLIKERTAP